MNAKRVLQCALVFAMPLGLLSTHAPAADNAAAIKEFGISKGEPINSGYLFLDHRYVEGPYVVERRGLDIYINGHLVRRSPEWPPYDYRVAEDPGEPPPGSSPLDPSPQGEDPSDGYWSRKWRYLSSHRDYETAKAVMVDAYRKCSKLREVILDEEDPFGVTVVDETGRRVSIGLTPFENDQFPVLTRDEILAIAESSESYFVRLLGAGFLLALIEGQEIIIGGGEKGARRMIGILLSRASNEEKLRNLDKDSLRRDTRQIDEIFKRFKPSPEIRRKLEEKLNAPAAKPPAAQRRESPESRALEKLVNKIEETPGLVEKLMGKFEEYPDLPGKLMAELGEDPDLAEKLTAKFEEDPNLAKKLVDKLEEDTSLAEELRRTVKPRTQGPSKAAQGGYPAPQAQGLSTAAWVAIGAWTLVGLTCAALILKRIKGRRGADAA